MVLVQGMLCPVRELVRMMPPNEYRLVSPDTTVSSLGESGPLSESWCLTVTGYSSEPRQTDSTPFITASNTRVRPGVIALSRDLLIRYTPGAPFAYGDSVLVAGQTYVVEDTMNRRWTNRADIWFPSTTEARRFGKQELELWRKA